MKKNALTVAVGILLILYALLNLGAGFGEFTKAQMVSGTSSAVSSLGDMAGDHYRASRLRREGREASTVLYLIAIFIFATAILDFVASVGLFSGANWAFGVLILAAICGILVEAQDIAEDGFGVGKAVFLGINGLPLITAFTARKPQIETTK